MYFIEMIFEYIFQNLIYLYFVLTLFINISIIIILIKNKFAKKYENIILVNTFVSCIYIILSSKLIVNIGFEIIFEYFWIIISFFIFILSKLFRIIVKKQKVEKKILKNIKIVVFIYSLIPIIVCGSNYLYEIHLLSRNETSTIIKCQTAEMFNTKNYYYLLTDKCIKNLKSGRIEELIYDKDNKIISIQKEYYTFVKKKNKFENNNEENVKIDESVLKKVVEDFTKRENPNVLNIIDFVIFKDVFIFIKNNENNYDVYKNDKYIGFIQYDPDIIYQLK